MVIAYNVCQPRPKPAANRPLFSAPIGTFLTSLDIVVVSTALPTLHKDPQANLSDLE